MSKELLRKFEEDIRFLAKRQLKCSKVTFENNDQRDTGISSNSLCGYAYDLYPIGDFKMPNDMYNYKSCGRLYNKLPKHRKTDRVKRALKKQKEAILN